jgi:hypothetical protein
LSSSSPLSKFTGEEAINQYKNVPHLNPSLSAEGSKMGGSFFAFVDKPRNSKSEYRNPKQGRNVQKVEYSKPSGGFKHLHIWICLGLRIWDFVLDYGGSI